MSSTIEAQWHKPATIQPNNFVNKSLSNWALNFAVGCNHACRFCYVPSVSTNKLKTPLAKLGVRDPDEQWGQYAFLRTWDENAFLASLKRAEETPLSELKPDGNRAVMLCSTTDPYQVFRDKVLQKKSLLMVERALRLILEHSTLRVRILTRSPLARVHFDLMTRFGDRLLFGMSLPTLREDLAKLYEPNAPGPSKRLETLNLAHKTGLNVYVAMAPTFPESDMLDLERTLIAVRELNPVTIFHEPINIRSENVERIRAHATKLGVKADLDVFSTPNQWRTYAVSQLNRVESLSRRWGLVDRIHLWPDKSLASEAALTQAAEWFWPSGSYDHLRWLDNWWDRISEWPGVSRFPSAPPRSPRETAVPSGPQKPN